MRWLLGLFLLGCGSKEVVAPIVESSPCEELVGRWKMVHNSRQVLVTTVYVFTETAYEIYIFAEGEHKWTETGAYDCRDGEGSGGLTFEIDTTYPQDGFQGLVWRSSFYFIGEYLWIGEKGGRRDEEDIESQ